MKRSDNASLKQLNSFAVEARAAQLVEIERAEDLQVFAREFRFDRERDLILGGGSNILFAGDIDGTVLLNRLVGRKVIDESDDTVLVEACAGENWHRLVEWSLEQGFSGLENLSLIPGLAGAAPIQNIGAYGVELADVLESVETLDLADNSWRVFSADGCRLGYRDSRFKGVDADRYLVTRIRLRLQRRFTAKLTYPGLRSELDSMGIIEPTAKQVSDAVVRLRLRKLPDPAVNGNAGSFFKNPLVTDGLANALAQEHRDMPVYPATDGMRKLSAAWLIEQCGWKGRRLGGAAVSEKHALVLVNRGNASGAELLELATAITDSVREVFAIDLVPEPRIVRP
ncbi:MAG: UDP-N-acetylmuramate dehydrogenase [Xanthomonadales bacterium]|nr:UDP-N-acetylmuramate dehydrogenase [Xanthomonadales bacterium]